MLNHRTIANAPERILGLAAALLASGIQIPILSLFVIHSLGIHEGPPQREMTIALDRASDPRIPFEPAEPSLLQPEAHGDVAPPAIQISSASRNQDLPPRPDPAHPNVQPSFASSSVNASAAEHLAARFVKAHWKFLPATENGRMVAKWTSLEVVVAIGE